MTEEQLFSEALAIRDLTERAVFLEGACQGRGSLLRRLQALLKAHDSAGDFLETPATRDVSASVSTEALAAGTMIDRYEIVRLLGVGGMGAVYLANQVEPVRRQVALKLVRPGLASAHVLTRFEAERQALAVMDHPHIARVLDAGSTEQGQPYFVMELIQGCPITEYCDTHALPLRDRLGLLIAVSQAVQHAHQKGILHRDLKPTNILIVEYDGRPTPKVIDFGIAKALGQGMTEGPDGGWLSLLAGTLEYMSPEQAQPDPVDVDSRSDVYALGILLYELLTGATPLRRALQHAASVPDMLKMIRTVAPPPPSATLESGDMDLEQAARQRQVTSARLVKLVRGELDWIAMKAIAKDRDRRYDTARDLGADLQRHLNDEPVHAAIPSTAYRLRKFVGKHRAGVATILASIVVLVGVTLWSLWLAYRATRAEDHAWQESQRATEERNRAVRAEAETARERDKAIAAQQLAQDEAAGAKAVLEFLVLDLFLESDPEKQPRSRQVTVEELMDRAASRIGGKFAQQPKTEAMIRQVMGVMYRKLGNLAAAQTHLERALELRLAHLGERDSYTLNTMDALAVVYDAQQKRDLALDLMRRSYAGMKEHYGLEHPQTRSTLGNLSVLLSQAGKLGEAEPLKLQFYQLTLSQYGEEHPLTLVALHNLAVLRMFQGRFDEAEQLYKQTLETRRRVLGPEHPRVITTMQMLGVLRQFQGRHDEAHALYHQVLYLCQKVLGADHPATLNTLRCQASNCEAEGKPVPAEALYREILRRLGQSPGRDVAFEADVLLALGDNLVQQQKYAAAAEMLQRSATLAANKNLEPWGVTYRQLLTAATLLGQEQSTAALPIVRAACQTLQGNMKESHWVAKQQILRALDQVERLCTQAKFTAEAKACQEHAAWLRGLRVGK